MNSVAGGFANTLKLKNFDKFLRFILMRIEIFFSENAFLE